MSTIPTTSGHEIRAARPTDAGQIASLFQLVYASSSHPCKRPDFVAQTLARGRPDVWRVSELGGRITGCMGMLPHRWNRSWEIVRGVTHPDSRGSGIATELAQRVVDEAWASGECDVVVAFPRNSTMYRIAANALTPGFQAVGHDGGINIADGRREYHLVALSFEAPKKFERVSPPNGSTTIAPFVQNQVLTPLGFPVAPGIYPPLLIAGEYPRHPDYGPFTFNYHPYCPSDSLELTAYTGPKQDPEAIAADLVTTLESFGYARHVRLAVLADKIEFQQMLRAAGFSITAYLPAWHLQNGVRYDCVLMTRRTTDEEPIDHGTRDLINVFNQGYAECPSSQTI
jgi:N-acetylglutamate synthase-like GNAT family acetyltransferase